MPYKTFFLTLAVSGLALCPVQAMAGGSMSGTVTSSPIAHSSSGSALSSTHKNTFVTKPAPTTLHTSTSSGSSSTSSLSSSVTSSSLSSSSLSALAGAPCDVTGGGSTCPPGPATEKFVPNYYDVPSKTQHIYYEKPKVEPIVTKIIHYIPTPVYGRVHTTETIHAGPWTGPSFNCCQPKPQPQIVYKPQPVIQPQTHIYHHVQPPIVTGCQQIQRSRYKKKC